MFVSRHAYCRYVKRQLWGMDDFEAPDSLLSPIKDNLQCAVCLEMYNDPRALPCQHVFCNQCLQNVISTTDPKCPECRYDLSNITDFPVAFQIKRVMEGFNVVCKLLTLNLIYQSYDNVIT